VSRTTVVSLDAAQHIDEATVGPKAMSLTRLNRIGLTIPRGFCITAPVLQEHLERNNLVDFTKATVAKLAKAEPQTKASILADLRAAIMKPPLTEEIQCEIETHYRALCSSSGIRRSALLDAERRTQNAERQYVAVRSSGTAEDLPGHSFAGQYDTYLGVGDLPGCIEAIKKCWASLWTLRAYEYRQKNGFDHLKIGMAVIVQTLIPADVSGVIFTADPLTGGRGRIIIEACFGLGEALVSGKVTPDRFIVGNRSHKIFTRIVSEKKIARTLAASGLVEEQAVPRERLSVCCLDNKQIKKLAKLAKKVETEFGCPQDIEWAIYKGKIFFLQSRPITALPPKKSWEDRQIWCCNPAKEVIPDVVTPMTFSVIDALLGSFIDPIFRVLCMDRGEHPIYGLVAGRIYFNGNIWGAVFRDLPGTGGLDFMKLAGGHKSLQKVIDKLRNADDEDLPDMKFKRYNFFLKIPLIIVGTLRNTPQKGRQILSKVGAENVEWSRLDAASLTTEEIAVYCHKIMMKLTERLGLILYLVSVLGALPGLEILCSKWLRDGETKAGELLAGMGNMVDAAAGLDIWRLAAMAHSKPEIRNLILSNKDWHTIEEELRRDDSGEEFLAAWNRFMLLHGHHCRGELELYNKRWSETPDYILKFVRSHLTQMGTMDAIQNFAAAAEHRRQLEQECRQQLKNPLKRIIFNHLLVRAQQGSVFRENIKSEVIKQLTAMRKLLIELGKKLADKGVLEKADDIFFLRQEEIAPVVNGKEQFDIRCAIAARRAEYDKNGSVTPPDAVFGRFDPENYVPDAEDEQTGVLNGLGVSPGRATGKARVILRADSDQQLLAGEILVAPFTDPGWTPYFVPAAAIVMDEGGVISHGSIVAREYGIPAVVNVGNGTRIIKTGQMIQVDGDSGVVRIVE
jgi:phosphohistidine swiveling domain-containing protein